MVTSTLFDNCARSQKRTSARGRRTTTTTALPFAALPCAALPFAALSFAAMLLSTSIACAPLGSPVDVEVILNAGPDGFELGVTTLETAVDLSTGRGQDFDILGGVKVPGTEAIAIVGNTSLYPTFEDIVKKTREVSGGQAVAPLLYESNGVIRGEDFDSLLYLTIFSNFEKVFKFYRDVVEDDSGATTNFGEVGFYAELVLASAFPVPIIGADNAAYYAPGDGWLTLRITDLESIPLAMNDGVIAHEFAHRSFFYNVFEGNDDAFNIWRSYTGSIPSDARTGRALNLLRGVDEGIADLHAVAYTRDPNFIGASVVGVSGLADQRNPEGDYATFSNYAILDSRQALADTGVGCTGVEISESGFNFYCLGTVLLRSLWDGAEGDVDILRSEISPAVRRALPKLGERIALETDGDETLDFEIEYLLEAIASELTGNRRDLVCAAFVQKFAGQILGGRVPTCF